MLRFLMGLALWGMLVLPAMADGSSSKQIRLVVPWPAGGSADLVGRLIANYLNTNRGESVYVDNRPGASGMIGSAIVAKAEPDGASYVISGIPSHVIAPAMADAPLFDPIKDFTHIAFIGGSPIVLVAHASLGVKTVADLIRVARSSRDPLPYVSPGFGSLGNLVAELFAEKSGISLTQVPYKGGTQALYDLIAGRVKLGAMTWLEAQPHVRRGELAALAISSPTRVTGFETLATFRELGHDELTTTTWWSFSGPARLPEAVVVKMNQDVNAALATPELAEKLSQQTIETEPMSAEQFTNFLKAEIKKWGPIAKKVRERSGEP